MVQKKDSLVNSQTSGAKQSGANKSPKLKEGGRKNKTGKNKNDYESKGGWGTTNNEGRGRGKCTIA